MKENDLKLSRIFSQRTLARENGELSIHGERHMRINSEYYQEIINLFKNRQPEIPAGGNFSDGSWYELYATAFSGAVQSFWPWLPEVQEHDTLAAKISFLLLLAEKQGWGIFQLRLEKNQIMILADQNLEAGAWLKTHKQQSLQPVCAFYAGLLRALCQLALLPAREYDDLPEPGLEIIRELLHSSKINVQETSCSARGDKYCTFSLLLP